MLTANRRPSRSLRSRRSPARGSARSSPGRPQLNLLPVEIDFLRPDIPRMSEPFYPDLRLPEQRVIKFDEETRIRVRVKMDLDNMQQFLNIFQNVKLKVKTHATKPDGVEIALNSQYCEFIKESDLTGTYSTLRVTLTRNELKSLGLVPQNDEDGKTEKSWYDTGEDNASSASNLSDGNAFDGGLNAEKRGRCTKKGHIKDEPPNSPLDKSFLCVGGVEYITADFGGAVSERRCVANQVDVFYFSGHGHHFDSTLEDGTGEAVSTWETDWNKEMKTAIIAGCSVLDIKDFRAQSFGKLTYLKYLTKGGAWSPGALWEAEGPKYLLGYCWTAPLDNQGSAGIITSFLGAMNGGVINAWRNANNPATNPAAVNACAIDTSVTPHEYWYWDETSGTPVWTKKVKGASGW
jgi:hypothetical protein